MFIRFTASGNNEGFPVRRKWERRVVFPPAYLVYCFGLGISQNQTVQKVIKCDYSFSGFSSPSSSGEFVILSRIFLRASSRSA